jgi:hypothetical protein
MEKKFMCDLTKVHVQDFKSCTHNMYLKLSCEHDNEYDVTGLVLELEHLNIETRLISERFANAMGECERPHPYDRAEEGLL